MAEINDLTGRLRRCMASGLLTYTDLGHWFEINRTTIMTWVLDARAPRDPRIPELYRRLELLETAVEDKVFPVPHEVSQQHRNRYIKEQYHAANDRGVPASASS